MIVKIKLEFPIGDLLYATKTIQDASGNWSNIITDLGILNRSIAINNSYEESGLSITFSDIDRYFRNMMATSNKYISGKTVTLYDIYDTIIYIGTVSSWSYPKNEFTINVTDFLSGINEKINETILVADFPNAADEAIGEFIPVIYGELSATLGILNCYKVATSLFLVARHHCKSIDNVFEDGAEIVGGWSMDNNADGNCYVNYAGSKNVIIVNIKGSMDISNNLITEPVEALIDMITNYTSIDYQVWAFARSESVMQARGYVINSIVTNETLSEYLKDFCYSFASDWMVQKQNRIAIDTVDPFTTAVLDTFSEKDVLKGSYHVIEDLQEMVNTQQVFYGYNYSTKEYKYKPVRTDTTSVTNWGSFFEEYYMKCTSDEATATNASYVYLTQRKNPIIKTYFSVRLNVISDLNMGGVILFSHPDGFVTTNQKYKILRRNMDFSDEFMQLELLRLFPLGGGMILGDRTALDPSWDDATTAEKEYAYLGDRDTGFFSNGYDPAKVLHSR